MRVFTGIVEELGEIVRRDDGSTLRAGLTDDGSTLRAGLTDDGSTLRAGLTDHKPDAARLSIRGPVVTSDAAVGDSIAVNGVCPTVVDVADDVFTADVIGETLRRSSLGPAEVGTRVNLERAVKLGDRLGGHLVQGHVDATGTLLWRAAPQAGSEPGEWELVAIGMPARLARYLVEKGSITVDGVSLTVIDVSDEDFTIGLIPTTRELTTLGLRRPGELVNLEVDVVAKYVERLTSPHLHTHADRLGDDAGEEVG